MISGGACRSWTNCDRNISSGSGAPCAKLARWRRIGLNPLCEVAKTSGDTLFASMYADYEALSDVLKSTVKGHKPLHSSRHVFGPDTSASRDEIGAVSPRGEPRATKQSDRKSAEQPATAWLQSQ